MVRYSHPMPQDALQGKYGALAFAFAPVCVAVVVDSVCFWPTLFLFSEGPALPEVPLIPWPYVAAHRGYNCRGPCEGQKASAYQLLMALYWSRRASCT